jgi:hypothetical protein
LGAFTERPSHAASSGFFAPVAADGGDGFQQLVGNDDAHSRLQLQPALEFDQLSDGSGPAAGVAR